VIQQFKGRISFFFSCPFVFWSAEQDFGKRNRVTTPANDTEALA
jgi:hypothetical protein